MSENFVFQLSFVVKSVLDFEVGKPEQKAVNGTPTLLENNILNFGCCDTQRFGKGFCT